MSNGEKLLPVEVSPNLKIISTGFLVRDKQDAVIWRGPMKYGVIKQFLNDVEWGTLDFLIVDSPPGTGDEPLSIAQLIGTKGEAVIVTTPQKVSVDDVRRSVTFCRSLNLKITGVIENMSGFVCPVCNTRHEIFSSDGGRKLAEEMDIPYLGSIPIEPGIVESGERGTPYTTKTGAAGEAFVKIVKTITT